MAKSNNLTPIERLYNDATDSKSSRFMMCVQTREGQRTVYVFDADEAYTTMLEDANIRNSDKYHNTGKIDHIKTAHLYPGDELPEFMKGGKGGIDPVFIAESAIIYDRNERILDREAKAGIAVLSTSMEDLREHSKYALQYSFDQYGLQEIKGKRIATPCVTCDVVTKGGEMSSFQITSDKSIDSELDQAIINVSESENVL